MWDRERLLLEIFRYRSLDEENLTPLITDLFLQRLRENSQSFVTDEIDDEVKFYTFHFRHQAERRLMTERKIMENRKKEILSEIHVIESKFKNELFQMNQENIPIFAVIGPSDVGKTSLVNYFTEKDLKDRIKRKSILKRFYFKICP